MIILLPSAEEPAPSDPPPLDVSTVRAGAIHPGSNGSLWIAEPKPREEVAGDDGDWHVGARWVLYRAVGDPEHLYWTHDNGGRPFLVRITPRTWAAYKRTDSVGCDSTFGGIPSHAQTRTWSRLHRRRWRRWEGADRAGEHIVDQGFKYPRNMTEEFHNVRFYCELAAGPMPYIRAFVGEDDAVRENYGKSLEDYGLGNSILVATAQRRFHAVTGLIVVINTPDEIKEYFSPIGNNDVPYPFAVGEQNVYLLLDSVYIPLGMWDRQSFPDPYEPYYDGVIGGPLVVPAAGVSDPSPTPQEARQARHKAIWQRMKELAQQYPIAKEVVMGRQWTADEEEGAGDE